VRQGIVIAVFLGIMVDYIKEKKWIKYIIASAILMFFHSAAFTLLIIPIILKFKLKTLYIINVAAFGVGFIMTNASVASLLSRVPIVGGQLANYIQPSISWISLAERIISFLIICFLFYYKTNKDVSKSMSDFMKIYSMGMAIYFVFMAFPLISSRIMVFFKIFEIILLPGLLSRRMKIRPIIAFVVIAISVVMFYKNMDSYILQGEYFANIGVFDYPYISIFNKDDIWKYREVSMYFQHITN
jgi:hypothetical protein